MEVIQNYRKEFYEMGIRSFLDEIPEFSKVKEDKNKTYNFNKIFQIWNKCKHLYPKIQKPELIKD